MRRKKVQNRPSLLNVQFQNFYALGFQKQTSFFQEKFCHAFISEKPTSFFFNFSFDKSRLKNLVSWFLKNYGQYKTLILLERLKEFGFSYATIGGLSLGIDDLKIPDEKILFLHKAETRVTKDFFDYRSSKITGIERMQRFIYIWNQTNDSLKQEVLSYFEKRDFFNPIYIMAFSGARGNMSQVRQLVGMRGLMSDPQGQIIDFPIQSNFREGLSLTEYLISTYGARKGIVDTALRTATAGYLTRRLVDVAQHVIISKFDCDTQRGIYVFDMKESKKTIYAFENRLIGRVLAQDFFSNDFSKKLLIRRNQEIDSQFAEILKKMTKKALVRSPLTCDLPRFVCQLCYGWSLSQGKLVSIGEAVGVIAAQSIGEPGTQLTMRTFHTGGVFAGGLTDQIFAPFDGQIHYLQNIPGKCIRTFLTDVAFFTKTSGSFVITKTTQTPVQFDSNYSSQMIFEPHEIEIQKNWKKDYSDLLFSQVYRIPSYAILFIRHGEFVQRKQLLAQFSSDTQKHFHYGSAEQTLFSNLSGEISFMNSKNFELIVEKRISDDSSEFEQKHDIFWKSKNWAKISVFAGKIFFLPFSQTFLFQSGDFLTSTTQVNRILWKRPVFFRFQPVFSLIPKISRLFYNLSTEFQKFGTIEKNSDFSTFFFDLNVFQQIAFFQFSNFSNHSFQIQFFQTPGFLFEKNALSFGKYFSKFFSPFIFPSQYYPAKQTSFFWENQKNPFVFLNFQCFQKKTEMFFSKNLRYSNSVNFLISNQNFQQIFSTFSKFSGNTYVFSFFHYFKHLKKVSKIWKQSENTFQKKSYLNKKLNNIFFVKTKQKNVVFSFQNFHSFYQLKNSQKLEKFSSLFPSKSLVFGKQGNEHFQKQLPNFLFFEKNYFDLSYKKIFYNNFGYTFLSKLKFSKSSVELENRFQNFQTFQTQSEKKFFKNPNFFEKESSKFLTYYFPSHSQTFTNGIFSMLFFRFRFENIFRKDFVFKEISKTIFFKHSSFFQNNFLRSNQLFEHLFSPTFIGFFDIVKMYKMFPTFRFFQKNIFPTKKDLLKTRIIVFHFQIKQFFPVSRFSQNYFQRLEKSREPLVILSLEPNSTICHKKNMIFQKRNVIKNVSIRFFSQRHFQQLYSEEIWWMPQENYNFFSFSQNFGRLDPLLQIGKTKKKTILLEDFYLSTYLPKNNSFFLTNLQGKKEEFFQKESGLLSLLFVKDFSLRQSKIGKKNSFYSVLKKIHFLQQKISFFSQNKIRKKKKKISSISSFQSLESFHFQAFQRNKKKLFHQFLKKNLRKKNLKELKQKFFLSFLKNLKNKKINYFQKIFSVSKKQISSSQKKIVLNSNSNRFCFSCIPFVKNPKQHIFKKSLVPKNSFLISHLSFRSQPGWIYLSNSTNFLFSHQSFFSFGKKLEEKLLFEQNTIFSEIKLLKFSRTNFSAFLKLPFLITTSFFQNDQFFLRFFEKQFPVFHSFQSSFEKRSHKMEKRDPDFFFSNFSSQPRSFDFSKVKKTSSCRFFPNFEKKPFFSFSPHQNYFFAFFFRPIYYKVVENSQNYKKLLKNFRKETKEKLFLGAEKIFASHFSKKYHSHSLNLQKPQSKFFEILKSEDLNIVRNFPIETSFFSQKRIFQKKFRSISKFQDVRNRKKELRKKFTSVFQIFTKTKKIEENYQKVVPNSFFFLRDKSLFSQKKKQNFQAYSFSFYPIQFLPVILFNSKKRFEKNAFSSQLFQKKSFESMKSSKLFPLFRILQFSSGQKYSMLFTERFPVFDLFSPLSESSSFWLQKKRVSFLFLKTFHVFENSYSSSISGKKGISEEFQNHSQVFKNFLFLKNPTFFGNTKYYSPFQGEMIKLTTNELEWWQQAAEISTLQKLQNFFIVIQKEDLFALKIFNFSAFSFSNVSKELNQRMEEKNNQNVPVFFPKKQVHLQNLYTTFSHQNFLHISRSSISLTQPFFQTSTIGSFLTKYEKKLYKFENLKIGYPNVFRMPILGQIFFGGETFSEFCVRDSGQLIHLNFQKLTCRKIQPFLLSPGGVFHFVNLPYVYKHSPIVTLPYQTVQSGDIVQGIPKVEQFFEARTTIQGRLFVSSLPILIKALFHRYCLLFPFEQAARQTLLKIQQIIVDGVQRVYRSQGVAITDKHLEVIVRQMTTKVQIVHGAQTGFFPGELVEIHLIENINKFLLVKIRYEPIVLGITRASLEVESFLSASSFQQTTKILAYAAISRKKDFLKGLKENLLAGNLIPSGTGYFLLGRNL